MYHINTIQGNQPGLDWANQNRQTWQLANPAWYPEPTIATTDIQEAALWLDLQPVDIKSRWRHNWKSPQVVNSHLVCDPQSCNRVSTSLGNSGLCWTVFARNRDTAVLAEGNATYRHWSVSLWRDPDDVPHCRILSPDKTELQLISATLCGWRHCFVADQLWLMTRIREEEERTNYRDVAGTVRTVVHLTWSVDNNQFCYNA